MSKRALLTGLMPIILLGAFLVGVVIFDRAQTAREQAYLATATVYIPPTTTTAPPTTTLVKAPVFSITDKAGKTYTMNNFAGKPTVLCFWNGSNFDSRAELSAWDEILEKYEDRVNLVVVHVNNRNAGMQKALTCLEEGAFIFTPYFDPSGDAARAYNISVFPTAFFINAQGEMKARAKGNISASDLSIAMERIGLTTK